MVSVYNHPQDPARWASFLVVPFLVVDVGAMARGARHAPRPPPPFQVPSESWRGGLKTSGGGVACPPWGRGQSGPRGVWRCLPSPPDSAGPLRGRGGARRGTPWSLPPRPSGGGYPAVVVWAVARCGACVPPARPRGRVGTPAPPGACGVSEPALAGWGWMPCCVKPFPTPQVCCFPV